MLVLIARSYSNMSVAYIVEARVCSTEPACSFEGPPRLTPSFLPSFPTPPSSAVPALDEADDDFDIQRLKVTQDCATGSDGGELGRWRNGGYARHC